MGDSDRPKPDKLPKKQRFKRESKTDGRYKLFTEYSISNWSQFD